MSEDNKILQYQPFSTSVSVDFWFELTKKKLEEYKLSEAPVYIRGQYNASQFAALQETQAAEGKAQLPAVFQIDSESLHHEKPAQGVQFSCVSPGVLHNTNTSETFASLDKVVLLDKVAAQIWSDIESGKAIEDSSRLNRFLLLTFADLKKHHFYYWFAFPALQLNPAATATPSIPADQALGADRIDSIREQLSSQSSVEPFFLIHLGDRPTVKKISEYNAEGETVFAFLDPCYLTPHPGWPLRNFLTLISQKFQLKSCKILCYREHHAERSSIVIDVTLPSTTSQNQPKAVGWEKKANFVNLSKQMDPAKLMSASVDLNLKLMQWRLMPSLQLQKIFNTKCLLLGAGTLGCNVARALMSWGVRHVTLVDNGKVSYSNPTRQSLFEFSDCRGSNKAEAAAARLRQIFPGMESRGVVMSIPMPGHPISTGEEKNTRDSVQLLDQLIAEHDAVFILTDSRESRWLPTLLCAHRGKIAINAALGFDSYLVMRHGLGRREEADVYSPQLGCYYCNDVVAPQNSLRDRTLDQQCTVTRPGLSQMASALAVELLVSILHHPLGGHAPADAARDLNEKTTMELGILPHSIRGFLAHFSTILLECPSYSKCTACSPVVVEEYSKRGFDMIKDAMNTPSYLEDLTGLTEMKKEAEQVSWEVEEADDDF
ncbi:hypothetical protein PROFUN_11963 [Planoprotostelium fungivorum]|uniref:Ubiquitin-like modifier-activating enzyme ATG7 n=1 Tax=Planoprotostelium fungivorum TaxID=1890364 RepID=A0A2P6N8X9_9EUKA|nr:hypothetical protein PROFUN_11963 [Planoprotostelium fungivorum]